MWAKVGSYPFWPGRVSRDPNNDDHEFKREPTSTGPRARPPRFHIAFYGATPSHSWVPENCIRPFSLDAIDDLTKEAMARYTAPGDKTQRAKESFFVAVDQARLALAKGEPDEDPRPQVDDSDSDGDDGDTSEEEGAKRTKKTKKRKAAPSSSSSSWKGDSPREPPVPKSDVCALCESTIPTVTFSLSPLGHLSLPYPPFV